MITLCVPWLLESIFLVSDEALQKIDLLHFITLNLSQLIGVRYLLKNLSFSSDFNPCVSMLAIPQLRSSFIAGPDSSVVLATEPKRIPESSISPSSITVSATDSESLMA